jgi:hypothetical protein
VFEEPSGLQYALVSSVAGGAVYVAVSLALDGTVDWVGGAVFMLVFGFVVTLGLLYSNRGE